MKITRWIISIVVLNILAVIFLTAYFDTHQVSKIDQSITTKFGISLGGSWPQLSDKELDETLDDIASIGISWLRFDMTWERAQPEENGPFHWHEFDRIVKGARKRNLKLLPILTYSPKWAGKPGKDGFQLAPANPDHFANFAGKAVKRYSPLGVNAYEIWNEPNMKVFWQPTPSPKEYTDLLKKSHIKIKQINPKAIVVSGGLAPVKNQNGNISAIDYLEGIYKNGAKDYFDALGYHPFSYPELPSEKLSQNSWWSQMNNPLRSIRSIMAKNDDYNKPIWATEFGIPTAGRKEHSESFQAQSIEDAALEMQNMPSLRVLFIYSYKDISTGFNPVENHFGIVRIDGTKKPAYYTIKKLLKKKNRDN